jgi:hypothetical protein
MPVENTVALEELGDPSLKAEPSRPSLSRSSRAACLFASSMTGFGAISPGVEILAEHGFPSSTDLCQHGVNGEAGWKSGLPRGIAKIKR